MFCIYFDGSQRKKNVRENVSFELSEFGLRTTKHARFGTMGSEDEENVNTLAVVTTYKSSF